jgi:hypothetical protein
MIKTPPGGEVIVPETVRLGLSARQTVMFVTALRDQMSDGFVTRWRGEVIPALGASRLLHHLPPPDGTDDGLQEWRSRFRLGLCYYRLGPDFVQIKDVRDPSHGSSFVIDDPLLVRTFLRHLVPTHLEQTGADERKAIAAMLAEGLMLRLGNIVVTLPYRMSRWPIPATAV